jgi:RNA polymerase sigma-70 factor, ECF subfamily
MDKKSALIEELPHLMRYARALKRDVTSADDLVQDCVGRALAKLDLFESGTNMRAWLFTIMHNIHRQDLRTASRRIQTSVMDEIVENQHGTTATQGGALTIRDLDQAMGHLPEDQRKVLLLIGLEDMSYKEVSEVLEIPLGTVMSRLSRGREKLKRLMDGEEIAQTLRSVK